MILPSKSVLGQFMRYNAVGVINTLIGFSIIFGLMFLGFDPILSNAVGYGVGSLVSFYLNKVYTFKATKHSWRQVLYFFMILGISYLINVLVLHALLPWVNPYLAQLMSAIVYTLSSFLLAKNIVFREESG